MQPDGGASQSATYHLVVAMPILATKLYVPPRRSRIVLRPRLDERLNEGLQRRLTLVSAPAGFGKSTLVAEWVAECGLPVAWLSLDEGDAEPTRFLAYLVEALRTVRPGVGEGVLAALGSPAAWTVRVRRGRGRAPRAGEPVARRRRPHLEAGVRQVVLHRGVRQAEAVGGRLLWPGDENGRDHADLTIRRAGDRNVGLTPQPCAVRRLDGHVCVASTVNDVVNLSWQPWTT